MADQEHLELLQQGNDVWNKWRIQHPEVKIDLSGADLSGADLRGANLRGADFYRANLSGTDLRGAELYRADFIGANLREVNLSKASLVGADLSVVNLTGVDLSSADLSGAYLNSAVLSEANLSEATLFGTDLVGAFLYKANLIGANLSEANLSKADLIGANLIGANLSRAILVETNLTEATLTQCTIYGISVWNVQLDGAKQENLVITDDREPTITVDNLEVAQFVYLLLNNPKIREVIDTVAKKAVLILGRFTPERKVVLEAIRTALRAQGYLPILFDFPKPDSQDLTGTVSTLASISRFIIADLTDPSCSPYEISLIAPYMKPIKSLFQPSKASKREFAMFQDLRRRYSWVLPIYRYQDLESLLTSLQEKVIVPAEQKAQMLEKKKRR